MMARESSSKAEVSSDGRHPLRRSPLLSLSSRSDLFSASLHRAFDLHTTINPHSHTQTSSVFASLSSSCLTLHPFPLPDLR